MSDTTIPSLSANALLFLITSLSPKAQDSIDKELYRLVSDEDTIGDQMALEDAFSHLCKDLLELGISIDIDPGDFVEDAGKLATFVEFVTLLLPNGLYPLMKVESSLTMLLRSCIEGSLGHQETVLQTYLSELGGLDNDIALKPHLSEFIDFIYPSITQTAQFTDYIRNLLELYDEERISPITDTKRHIEYSTFLKDYIGDFSDAVDLYSEISEFDKLDALRNVFVRDLLKPDKFIDYSYLFLENKDTLPEDLHEGHARKLYYYKVSHPWCQDYYTIRNLVPEPTQRYAMLCWTFAQYRRDKTLLLKELDILIGAFPQDAHHDLIMTLVKDVTA